MTRSSLRAVLQNAGWLWADKVLRFALGLGISAWVARYLGPADYGVLNYVQAIVTLLTVAAGAGLPHLAIRDLVSIPEKEGETMGTVASLRLGGGLLALCIASVAVSVLRPGDHTALAMTAMLCGGYVLRSCAVFQHWFSARMLSRYVVLATSAGFLVASATRPILILAGASVLSFAAVLSLEQAVVAGTLLLLYQKTRGGLRTWSIDRARARRLVHEAWPLVLSHGAGAIYLRADIIMIGEFLGDEAAGKYAAAATLSGAWHFTGTAVVMAMSPLVHAAHKENHALFLLRLKQLFSAVVLLAYAVAIPVTFMGPWLVPLLFGEAYAEAGSVLALHVWSGVFVFLGSARGLWVIAEGRSRLVLLMVSVGALTNLATNYLFIPKYGLLGAAVSTTGSYFVGSVLINFLHHSSRELGWMIVRSLFPISFTLQAVRLVKTRLCKGHTTS